MSTIAIASNATVSHSDASPLSILPGIKVRVSVHLRRITGDGGDSQKTFRNSTAFVRGFRQGIALTWSAMSKMQPVSAGAL
jgi:hypothetical protein